MAASPKNAPRRSSHSLQSTKSVSIYSQMRVIAQNKMKNIENHRHIVRQARNPLIPKLLSPDDDAVGQAPPSANPPRTEVPFHPAHLSGGPAKPQPRRAVAFRNRISRSEY
jgi:hypothetical protein